jgi:hypothetical protein
MEQQICSSSKNSFILESHVQLVLGHVATFIASPQHANVLMSVADTNSTPQLILPNINGSYCLNKEKRNEVKDTVLVQEGKYCHLSTLLF